MSSSYDKRVDDMFDEDRDAGSSAERDQANATMEAWEKTNNMSPVVERVIADVQKVDPAAANALFAHFVDEAAADLASEGRTPDRSGGGDDSLKEEVPEGINMDFVADSLQGHGTDTHGEPTESFGGGGGKPPGGTAGTAGWMSDNDEYGGEGGEGDEGEGEGGEGEGGGDDKGKGDKDKGDKPAKAAKSKEDGGGRAARGKGDAGAGADKGDKK